MGLNRYFPKFLLAAAVAGAVALPFVATSADAQVGISIGINAGPRVAPPPPRWERRPARPWADGVWVDGRWDWVGARWAWRGGHWDHPPHPGALWHRGVWANRGGHYVWTEGHW
jgi:hypothetical protein